MAFLITSQEHYLSTYRAKELVEVPPKSTACLKKKSWIQCFNEVQRLDVSRLLDGEKKRLVTRSGELKAFLSQIRVTVECSETLSSQDIDDVLAAIDIGLK
ncbi:MAG: hypothetical protein ACYDD2_10920 [Candidatus Acidiferrales bacterium]